MTTKRWVQTTLFLAFTTLISIGGFNYFLDPLWCFKHKNFLQSHREGFNERQQKINLIHFGNLNFQGVILGSSRVTVHDSKTFLPLKIFNLAADGMTPYEFQDYVEFAKTKNGSKIDTIFLGLDLSAIGPKINENDIHTYINTSYAPLYRYKTLITYDTTSISIKNLRNTLFNRYKKRFKTYNEEHIAHSHEIAPDKVNHIINEHLKLIQNDTLKYDRNNYIKALKTLRKNNPSAKFIAFTTPLPDPVLKVLLSKKSNRDIYYQWLNDITTIFGNIHHFCYSNLVSQNYSSTFIDPAHYTSDVGNCINLKIQGEPCKGAIFNDFGLILNESNISQLRINSFNR